MQICKDANLTPELAFEALEFLNQLEVVEFGKIQPYALACELRLASANGFEIVRSLRRMARYRALNIAVVSSLSGNEVRAHGGFPDHELMGKPVDYQRLLSLAHAVKLKLSRMVSDKRYLKIANRYSPCLAISHQKILRATRP